MSKKAPSVTSLAEVKKARRQAPGVSGEWVELLDHNRDGSLRLTLHNVVLFLENHPEWFGLFAYNSFSNTIEKMSATPYSPRGAITDADAGEAATWLADPRNAGMNVRPQLAMQSIEVVAWRRKFNPVKEYLEKLIWDQTERLPYLFTDFCGTEQTDYVARVGVMVAVSAVARIFSPGCKVDFMVVLEGPQDTGKTTFVRELAGEQWFAEAMESPAHKDFYQALQGRWIIEISEMHSFSKTDVTKVKQAVSTQADVYRRSYERYARAFPRQCIFIGTTNEECYLRDATGARRFLPIKVTSKIDIEALRQQRDQIWAEAVHRYRAGERYWIMPERAADEQEARYQSDSWEEVIIGWLSGQAASEHYAANLVGPIDKISTTELMQYALRIEIGKHTRQDQMRVGAIMRRLGWERGRERVGKAHQYFYFRPKREKP